MMWRLLLAILSIGWCSLSSGQPYISMDELFDMSLEDILKIRVTSATRHEESLKSVPASVTVYSRKQIRALGIDRLTELMNFVPGFQSQRVDNASFTQTFSSRGTSLSGSAREILILLDGQRLNSDWIGGVQLMYGLINLDKVERVEFIRGPGSAIYGSNAFLGVINLITRANNEASLSLGSHGQIQASLQWQQPLKNGGFEVFINTIEDDGQTMGVYDPFIGSNISTKDPYQFKEIHLKAHHQDLSLSVHHNNTQAQQFYVAGFVGNEANQLDSTHWYFNLQHHYPFTKNIAINTKASLARRGFIAASLISAAPAPNELGLKAKIEEQEPLVEATLDYQDDDARKVLMGIEWRRPKITNSDANFFGSSNQYKAQAPLIYRSIYGVFFQYQAQINHQLNYVLGVRNDNYSNFESHLSPRGGLIFQYDGQHTIKGLYGESFRAPSPLETNIQNSPSILANPNLEAEIARTVEVIWQRQTQNHFLATTLFYSELRNVIVKTVDHPVQLDNSGSEQLAGIEVEWHKQWTENVQSRVNFSWILDEAQRTSSEANMYTGATVIYRTQSWSAALLVNHHASKEDVFSEDSADNLTTVNSVRDIPQRSFLDANVRRFLPHNLELYLRLKNIANQDYYSASLRADNPQGVPNRGTSILGGLRWAF